MPLDIAGPTEGGCLAQTQLVSGLLVPSVNKKLGKLFYCFLIQAYLSEEFAREECYLSSKFEMDAFL